MPEKTFNKSNNNPDINGCQTKPKIDSQELSSVSSCSSSISQDSDNASMHQPSALKSKTVSDSQKKHVTFSNDLINGLTISDKEIDFDSNKVTPSDSCTEKDFEEIFDSFNHDPATDGKTNWNNFIESYDVFYFFARKYRVYTSGQALLSIKREIIQKKLNELKIKFYGEYTEIGEDTDEETRQEPIQTRHQKELDRFFNKIGRDKIFNTLKKLRDYFIRRDAIQPLDAQALQEVTTLSPQP
jgi:hypothetical protein